MTMNSNVTASFPKSLWVVAVALLSSPLFLPTASAQFSTGFPGQTNLPQNDFTWTWGNQGSARRRIEDFSIFGYEGTFRCELTGKLRLGSRLSRMDVRELESDLRASSYFVSAAANAMNDLDARRELEWATLECEKPQAAEEDQEERDERQETG